MNTEVLSSPTSFAGSSQPRKKLIDDVYPDIASNIANCKWLQQRAILTPLNAKVEEINFNILQKLQTAATAYTPIDRCLNDEEATNYPIVFEFAEP